MRRKSIREFSKVLLHFYHSVIKRNNRLLFFQRSKLQLTKFRYNYGKVSRYEDTRIYIVYKRFSRTDGGRFHTYFRFIRAARYRQLHMRSLLPSLLTHPTVHPFSPGAFSPKRDVKENCLFNGEAGITGR